MANKKYQVRCNNRFLGHYHSTSPEGAVRKAITANEAYHPWINSDEKKIFTATKGGMSDVYTFYSDSPVLEAVA